MPMPVGMKLQPSDPSCRPQMKGSLSEIVEEEIPNAHMGKSNVFWRGLNYLVTRNVLNGGGGIMLLDGCI